MYLILIAVLIFVAIIIAFTYNSIIGAKNNVEESYSAIETMFQNRYDLIPNLVEVVKQYAKHEKDLFTNVTKLRSNMLGNQGVTKEKLEQENQLSGTLKSIFSLSENYPDLKANENFINLQNEWTEMEEKIQASRRGYNSAVKTLDNKRQMFPSSIIAGMMTIKPYPMFEAAKEARASLSAKDMFNS